MTLRFISPLMKANLATYFSICYLQISQQQKGRPEAKIVRKVTSTGAEHDKIQLSFGSDSPDYSTSLTYTCNGGANGVSVVSIPFSAGLILVITESQTTRGILTDHSTSQVRVAYGDVLADRGLDNRIIGINLLNAVERGSDGVSLGS